MKIIYNNILPFEGFVAITIWPFIFVRKKYNSLSSEVINHENIHGKQQKELLWIFFFLWYGTEFIIRLIQFNGISGLAYRWLSFEREAYLNEYDLDYLKTRKWWSFLKYL